MQESLFSKRQSGQPPAPAASASPILPPTVRGVGEVLNYLRRLIAANRSLAATRVRGEVSGLNTSNGILRFNLAEGKESLQCIVWAKEAPKFAALRDGDQVICAGEFSVYTGRGVFQLIVTAVEYTGAGAIYAEMKALEEKLRKEGLFDRKRRMPEFPRRIAVVSARSSRGVNDFLTTIAKRAPFIEVSFVETRVQGDGAEIDIAAAIDAASRLNVDLIVLTRGGGSVEDLLPFNKEPVARAIARSKHPVLSAIGHNLDIHVSDQVADHACETPSNAAQYFGEIADRFALRVRSAAEGIARRIREIHMSAALRVSDAKKDLRSCSQTAIAKRGNAVVELERRLQRQTPQERLTKRRDVLTRLVSRLESSSHHATAQRSDRVSAAREQLHRQQPSALARQRERVRYLAGKLEVLDPERILERGYAIVTYQGRAVTDAGTVPCGAVIEAKVQHGKLTARVEEPGPNG